MWRVSGTRKVTDEMIVLTNVQKYHSKTGTQYGSLVGTYMSVISSIPYDITKKLIPLLNLAISMFLYIAKMPVPIPLQV